MVRKDAWNDFNFFEFTKARFIGPGGDLSCRSFHVHLRKRCLISVYVWRRLMSSYQLVFPGVRSPLVFWGFGLKPPASGLIFSLILIIASRLLHLYSTLDKTSRLKMKSFSTVRDTQRGTQSYLEKRRGRREIEVTRRGRGEIKMGESKLASNHFPMCSPQSGSLRDVHGVTQRR